MHSRRDRPRFLRRAIKWLKSASEHSAATRAEVSIVSSDPILHSMATELSLRVELINETHNTSLFSRAQAFYFVDDLRGGHSARLVPALEVIKFSAFWRCGWLHSDCLSEANCFLLGSSCWRNPRRRKEKSGDTSARDAARSAEREFDNCFYVR